MNENRMSALRAFSSEVDTGSREENASKQKKIERVLRGAFGTAIVDGFKARG
jgi:hypothetical protein